MIEDEQNLRKILEKVHWQNVQKGIYIKKKTSQYIVKATKMPNSNIN